MLPTCFPQLRIPTPLQSWRGGTTVNDLQCEQLAVDPTPTAGVLGDTMAPVLPLDKEDEPDQTAVPKAATEVLPRLSLADLQLLQQQDPVLSPVLATWPAKPSDTKERSMRALVQQYPRLFLKKGVLHRRQADQRRGTLEQLVLPTHFGLMSWRRSMTIWATKAMSAPWSC